MQFSEIIGQQEVKTQLVELVQHNRLSHALLFLSKEGSGALQLAIALAQYITCEKIGNRQQAIGNHQMGPSLFGEEPNKSEIANPKSAIDSCGECASCKKAS